MGKRAIVARFFTADGYGMDKDEGRKYLPVSIPHKDVRYAILSYPLMYRKEVLGLWTLGIR